MKKSLSIILVTILLMLTLAACARKQTPKTEIQESVTSSALITQNENQEIKPDAKETADITNAPEATVQPDGGKQIKITILDNSWKNIGQYSEGLCPVQDNNNGLWGYVDRSGEYVIESSYYEAYPFSEGLAAVKNKNGKLDFIDKTGKIVFSSDYTRISSRYNGALKGFLRGYAVVSFHNNNVGEFGFSLIDKTGKVIAKDDYFFRIAAYGKPNGPFIDCQGNIVDMSYKNVAMPKGNGRKIDFSYSTKYILWNDKVVDEKGAVVFDASGIEADSLGLTDDYLVAKKNVNGVVTSAVWDFTGKIVIDYNYKDIYPINSDTFVVVNNGNKYGVVNKELQELIPISQTTMILPFDFKKSTDDSVRYYDSQAGMSRLSYMGTDDKGIPTRYYYDLSKKQIAKDAQIFNPNGDPTYYNYINDDIVYMWNGNSITIYSTEGIEAGKISGFFGTIDYKDHKASLFVKDNIIPTMLKDKNGYSAGYTFAVIESMQYK